MAFQRVLATRPDFFPALKNLAVLEWQTKKPLAAQHTEQGLKIEPRDPVLNSYAALSDLKGKNVSAASQHLELAANAISAMPPAIEMRLAYLLGTNGLYAQAARVYQDIVARGGRSSTLTYNLGLAQYLAGNYEDAIHTLEEAESRGHSLDGLNLLAQVYEKNHQTQQAIDRLREAITLFPADENSYLDLATICIDHNSYPLGIEIVQLGLKNKPGSEKLLFSSACFMPCRANLIWPATNSAGRANWLPGKTFRRRLGTCRYSAKRPQGHPSGTASQLKAEDRSACTATRACSYWTPRSIRCPTKTLWGPTLVRPEPGQEADRAVPR